MLEGERGILCLGYRYIFALYHVCCMQYSMPYVLLSRYENYKTLGLSFRFESSRRRYNDRAFHGGVRFLSPPSVVSLSLDQCVAWT